jgi:diamine N-acetyltransferase
MITLRTLTEENIRDCLKLDAGNGKIGFVANSFAIAWLHRDSAEPLIICNHDEPVGFLMLIMSSNGGVSKECYLSRIMIDKNHRRKGYAKSALLAAIDHVKQNTDCALFRLSVSPENAVAKSLYESLGFLPSGEMLHGEIVMILKI